MKIPILKQGSYLIASLQQSPADHDLRQLREELIVKIGTHRSRGVIIDVSAVDVLDSFATRTLRDIAHIVQLRGAQTVVVGIQPDVAFTMVQLGLTMEGIPTALDLEAGLEVLNRLLSKRGEGPWRRE